MKKILIIIMVFIITSCATSQYAKIDNNNIKIYITKLPDKPYKEIGYIETSGSIFTTEQGLLNALLRKAKKVNADAIINIKRDYQGWWPVLEGVAIKFE